MDGPSTSKQAAAAAASANFVDVDDDFQLVNKLDEDEKELARFQEQIRRDLRDAEICAAAEKRAPKINFKCSNCDMDEMVHYFGQTPPFAYGIKYVEDTYVMMDPFKPPPSQHPRAKPVPECYIGMGAICVTCQRIVCKATECSFFYERTYCLSCAKQRIDKFPAEVKVKLRKQIAAVK